MERTITPTEYKMLIWSMDFILHNPDITTNNIPVPLLKFWTIPGFTEKPEHKGENLQILIFMFVLRLYCRDKEQGCPYPNTDCFNQLLYCFQVILITTVYYKETNIKIKPFPLFDIEKYILSDLSHQKTLLQMYEAITNCQIIE